MRDMRQLLGLSMLLMGSCFSLSAHEYPSIHTPEEIVHLYLKTPQEVVARKEKVKKEFHEELKAFLSLPNAKTSPSHLLQTFDAIIAKLMQNMSCFELIGMVEPKESLRKAYTESYQDLRQDYIATFSEMPEIYRLFASLEQEASKSSTLSAKERYYLKTILESMRLEGLHLPDPIREEVKHVSMELATLSNEFAQNIQEDRSQVKVSLGGLKGMDAHFLSQLTPHEEKYYLLTCDYPTYFPIMRSCQDEKTRKELYRAFGNRAYPRNMAVLDKIIAKRDEFAKLLGFTSFAECQLSQEMVHTPAAAEEFLERLLKASTKKRQEEIADFKKVLPELSLSSSGKVFPWDVLYAQQRVKETYYELNQDLIKEYFPLETTIDGLIWLFENFLSLKMTQEKITGLWHEDVKLLKVADKASGKVYGYILLDLFPRPNKYSHACHGTIVAGLEQPGGSSTTSLGIVIANFPKSTPTRPSLMFLTDVKTFFHELGHAIHAVLGRTQFVGTSGTNVKVDFVELPSQMLEEWLYEPEILQKIGSHYETHQPLPDAWIKKIQATRGFGSGQFIGQQCFLSELSLKCFGPGAKKDTNQIITQLYEKLNLETMQDPEAHMQASFGHLEGYGARYYGYLWSRVFAADIFAQIKKEGLLSPQAGERYRKMILEQGGSEDPAILLKNYLGRDPSQEAFLELYKVY